MAMAISRRALLTNAVALSSLVGASACQRTAESSDALGDLDATGVAAKIRSGEINATEALEAAIARAERVNPELNFIAAAAPRAVGAAPRSSFEIQARTRSLRLACDGTSASSLDA